MLVAGAGLMIRSYARLAGIDPGFAAERLVSARVALPETDYPQRSERVTAFYDALALSVRALPGVESASLAQALPLGGNDNSTWASCVTCATPAWPSRPVPRPSSRSRSSR